MIVSVGDLRFSRTVGTGKWPLTQVDRRFSRRQSILRPLRLSFLSLPPISSVSRSLYLVPFPSVRPFSFALAHGDTDVPLRVEVTERREGRHPRPGVVTWKKSWSCETRTRNWTCQQWSSRTKLTPVPTTYSLPFSLSFNFHPPFTSIEFDIKDLNEMS